MTRNSLNEGAKYNGITYRLWWQQAKLASPMKAAGCRSASSLSVSPGFNTRFQGDTYATGTCPLPFCAPVQMGLHAGLGAPRQPRCAVWDGYSGVVDYRLTNATLAGGW